MGTIGFVIIDPPGFFLAGHDLYATGLGSLIRLPIGDRRGKGHPNRIRDIAARIGSAPRQTALVREQD